MGVKEISAAALAAAREEQFAQPVEGVDLWIWSSPRSPDLDALLALALQAGGNDVLTSIRPERLGLQIIVNAAIYIFPWGALSAAAFGQLAGLLQMQAGVSAERIRAAALSIVPSTQPVPEPEADDGRTIH